MNREDAHKWLTEDMSESELEKIEVKIMADLKEYRLKEQFKQRLKTQRERREWMKNGLIALAFLVVIALLVYTVSKNPKTEESSQTPSLSDKPIVEQQQLGANMPTNDSIGSISNKIANSKDTVLIEPNIATSPPQYREEKPNTTKPAEPMTFVKPPIDTEYLYLTSSERRPVYFYTTTENERDTFTTLDLSREKLTEIPAKVFPYTQLKILLVNRNQLKQISDKIAELTHLEQLDLSQNKLTVLPKALTELSNLVSLNLESNRLTALPTDIGQLQQLTMLNMSTNKLMVLPESLGQLSRLTDLDLSDNAVKTLPQSIAQLSNLTNLNIGINGIKEFPMGICALTNLTNLDMHDNRLYKLPKEIGQLKNLKTLDLSKNSILRLPKEIKELKNLTYLNLTDNLIGYDEMEMIRRWLPNCRIEY